MATLLAAGSFLIVAFSPNHLVTYTGVVCASLSSGLGEVEYSVFSGSWGTGGVSD